MEQNEPMEKPEETEELSGSATPITAVTFYRKASSVAELLETPNDGTEEQALAMAA